MIKYKIIQEDSKENIAAGFKVMVKKNFFSRWKYVRRVGEPNLDAWWSTKKGAQAYINLKSKKS